MAVDLVIPKLGMTMVEAKVAEWKAREGDWVEEKAPVLVIETEKVSYEVEALGSGFLHILAVPGAVLPVGGVAGRLAGSREDLARMQGESPGGPTAEGKDLDGAEPSPTGVRPERRDRIEASPVARKMAEAHGLDLGGIRGTGPGGRIKREDVERALASREAPPPPALSSPTGGAAMGKVVDGKRVKDTIPLTGIRGAVAEHMKRSLAVSAQLTSMGEFDAAELVRMKEALKAQEGTLGFSATYTDLLVFILGRVLRKNPMMNATVLENEVVLWEDVHIGVAVSLPWRQYDAGLVVPVVKNADCKSLPQISREIRELRGKAASGTLSLEEISGGTFTLSNVGVFGKGYTFTTPILHQPQTALLLTGAILDRAVVVEGSVRVRPVMTWSLTFDHRAVSGAPAGKFLVELNEYLINPYLLLADLPGEAGQRPAAVR
jgi:pyruvate dehydrogenase E2 component (dihydrolipoamide acetyltransferase)/2-oxoglutarate dehydrogenase E2 component (dihydrolipoamide succinyltransferase)